MLLPESFDGGNHLIKNGDRFDISNSWHYCIHDLIIELLKPNTLRFYSFVF